MKKKEYEKQLKRLQLELTHMQEWLNPELRFVATDDIIAGRVN